MTFCDSALAQTVRKTIDDYGMLQDCRRVVVGFSGGADSVCLLSVLASLAPDYGVSLLAVHINHCIRGEEAERDASFSRDFCERLGIPFLLKSIDCPAEAKASGESLETCARRLRYDCFSELREEGDRIATAHNANDNAETVLLNLSRGASLKGACGIPPMRDAYIRPLLFCTRNEIEAWCRERALTFVTDSSNLSDEFSRNRIRHLVLPVLQDVNSAVIPHFGAFTVYARRDDEYLTDCAVRAMEDAVVSDNAYRLDAVRALPEPVKRRFAEEAVKRFSGKGCEQALLHPLMKTIDKGGRVRLQGLVTAEAVGGLFRLFLDNPGEAPERIPCPLPFDGVFGQYSLQVTPYIKNSKRISRFVLDNLLDYDRIDGELFWRTREPGDTFSPLRRGVTKPLKKLLQEQRVPLEERDCLPLLCDGSGIVWVYGVGVAARCQSLDFSTHNYLIGGSKL